MINSQKHLVLYNVHPSPLAGQGFVTIKDFSKANTYLKQMGKEPIDWNVDWVININNLKFKHLIFNSQGGNDELPGDLIILSLGHLNSKQKLVVVEVDDKGISVQKVIALK